MGIIILPVGGMTRPEAFGNEGFDGMADQIRRGVTKQLRRTRVCRTNDAISIRDKYGIWRSREQVLQCKSSELGPFNLCRSRCVLIRESDGRI